RPHLQRTVEPPRITEACVRHVVRHRTVAPHRAPLRRRDVLGDGNRSGTRCGYRDNAPAAVPGCGRTWTCAGEGWTDDDAAAALDGFASRADQRRHARARTDASRARRAT